jgi:hypothetical protein
MSIDSIAAVGTVGSPAAPLQPLTPLQQAAPTQADAGKAEAGKVEPPALPLPTEKQNLAEQARAEAAVGRLPSTLLATLLAQEGRLFGSPAST